MALNMEALLKIKADVQGEGAVQGLATKLGGLQKAGAAVSGSFKGLAGAAGGLVGGLQTLMPLATGAGMVAMAKGAIDAADNMNDLSQKTGVSVERLSQLKQAAEKSGTTLESVGGAMIKLNRNLVDGKAQEALRGIGISATDATGKLKPTDQILLEVSKKFAAMPDGAQKSALAMQLFGKSGADMIPMLNMGDQAIKDLAVTMTGEFAKGSDEFNDKMVDLQTGMAQLGVSLGTALMPFLSATTDALVAMVNGFNALPGPVQGLIAGVGALVLAFIALAPAIASVISIAGALSGLQLGATIAGWLGAIGPAIAGITAAFSGLLAWIGSTLIPGLLAVFTGPVGWTVLAIAAVVAMCIAFREPILNFFSWLGGAIGEGLNALWQWGEPIRKFWVDAFSTVGTIIQSALSAIGGILKGALSTWWAITYQIWVRPWIELWNRVLREPVTKMVAWVKTAWQGITSFFTSNVIQPISKGWDAMVQLLPKAMESAANFVKGVWTGMIESVKGVVRGLLQYVANAVNTVVSLINRVISGFNALPGPDIPFVPTISVPAFAKGGYVGGGTLAMVGEAGPEYIIPERKMMQASMNYLNGARGGAVIPAYAQGGYVGGNAQINVTTGPVMQQGGQQYVSMADLERAMRKTADGIYASLRTPAGRYAVGVR